MSSKTQHCYRRGKVFLFMLYGGITKEDESSVIENFGVLLGHTPMTWKIECIENHGIVKIKTSGSMNLQDNKKFSEEALATGRGKNVNAFLVDQQESHFGLSILEIDQIPKIFRDAGFNPSDKLAILVNPESISKDLLKFIEDVFYLSSLQIKIFSDADEAKYWLKEKI
jgi:hypothetical protein